ncbi:MAG: putative 2OG-Fe(II) oxygenase [Pseudohongiellaceae bacterium]|jgi:uncharacterized protein (TIGR02466 family)
MELLDLFPKTIAVADLKTLTPDLIARAIDHIALTSANPVAGDGGFTSDQQLLERVLFREVKQEILALCREFAAAWSHRVEDLHICNSWGNQVRHGDTIRLHRHSNAYISGSFYLTEGSAFSIVDIDRTSLFGGFLPECRPDGHFRSRESLSINPKPGRVILFPASLMHCVLASQSPEPRYSIAFNVIPLGRFGPPTGRLEIPRPA